MVGFTTSFQKYLNAGGCSRINDQLLKMDCMNTLEDVKGFLTTFQKWNVIDHFKGCGRIYDQLLEMGCIEYFRGCGRIHDHPLKTNCVGSLYRVWSNLRTAFENGQMWIILRDRSDLRPAFKNRLKWITSEGVVGVTITFQKSVVMNHFRGCGRIYDQLLEMHCVRSL